MAFLGSALSSTLIYIWSRKNPDTLLSFLGLLVFKAPYLPWVLLCFSLIMHGTVPKDEMCGIVVGHSRYPIFNVQFCPNALQFGTTSTISTHRYTTDTAH
jgi:Derlin-2/3